MDTVSLAAKQRQFRIDRAKNTITKQFSNFFKTLDKNTRSVQNRTMEFRMGLGTRVQAVPSIRDKMEAEQRAAGKEVELPYNTLFGAAPAVTDTRTEEQNRSVIGFIADTYRKQHGRLPSVEELRGIFSQNQDIVAASPTFELTLNSYNPAYYTGNQ